MSATHQQLSTSYSTAEQPSTAEQSSTAATNPSTAEQSSTAAANPSTAEQSSTAAANPSTPGTQTSYPDEKTITGMITRLEPNEVFVFGSNLGGRHGAGAARKAREWGAIWGNPVGHQGQTYAIPTVDASVRNTLSLAEIQPYAIEFIEYAKEHPELVFLLTDVGCGLAGLRAEDVAPLFLEALTIPNIRIHHKFMAVLSSKSLLRL